MDAHRKTNSTKLVPKSKDKIQKSVEVSKETEGMIALRNLLNIFLTINKMFSLSLLEISLERMAEVNSVLRIIAESIGKLKICLILPQIFDNPMILQKSLNSADYEYCKCLIDEYIQEKVQMYILNFEYILLLRLCSSRKRRYLSRNPSI